MQYLPFRSVFGQWSFQRAARARGLGWGMVLALWGLGFGWIVCVPLEAATAPEATAKEPPSASIPKTQNRWEPRIRQFEEMDRKNPPPSRGIVFVGSSSIVGWDLKKFFPDLPVINRGFGGSQLADAVYFADRIVLPYQPKIVVLYAGDNDIASGKSPEQVAADYDAFVAKVHQALPKTKILYITIKPSIARWKLFDKMRQANALIRARADKDDRLVVIDVEKSMLGPDGMPRPDLLQKDGLHLNDAGYKIWSDLVRPHLTLAP